MEQSKIQKEIQVDMQKSNDTCCGCHTKHRDLEEYKKLCNRLSRVEGQVRGIKKMLQEDAYCIDILNQVAAVNSALNSFSRELLADHIKTCVTEDIQNGGDKGRVDELLAAMQKLMK